MLYAAGHARHVSSQFSLVTRVLLTAEEMARTLTRLAHEVVESNRELDELVLVGIQTRGVPIAERLASTIAEIEGLTIPTGALDVTLFRDDLHQQAPRPLGETRIPVDINGRTVIIVDDVFYTGRTVRAALDGLAELGRPQRIRLVVLVDRGHRELPIRADHVGKNLPTAYNDRVRVRVAEVDGVDDVVIDEGAA
ncbi:MAG: bifunctional pyr operon transcriptional regulator/uracil phosphoribosyltransferase PyrR [Nitriliruptoraceae bacterium]